MSTDSLRRTEERMRASVTAFANDLATIRTGRATPALVEHVKIDYDGVPMPLNQLASISAPDARMIVIHPWDKGSIAPIEKGILKSELGLNPTHDGAVIRIAIPPLSEERRQDLIKVVHKRGEERRIMVRTIRREGMEDIKKLEKQKVLSQDESKRALDRLQKVTDGFMARVDEIVADKEAEIKEV